MATIPTTLKMDERDEDFEIWLQKKLDKQKARQMERQRLRQEEKRKEKKLVQQNKIGLMNEAANVQNTNLQEGVKKIQQVTQNEDSEKTQTQIFLVSSTPQSKSNITTNVSSPCAQDMDLGGDMSPSGFKRKRDVLPGSSKKAKGSFPISSGEDIVVTSLNDQSKKEHLIQSVLQTQQMEEEATIIQPQQHGIASTSLVNLSSQVLVSNPEVLIGSNSGKEQLSADQSALHEDVAPELKECAHGPAEIVYSTQWKDPWEIYTHIANCLTGAIKATTDLHSCVPQLSPSTCETDKLRSSLSKIEKELLHKNSELEAAFEKSNWRYKALSTMYNQLELETKKKEDAHIKELACLKEQYKKKLAREKLHAIQTSVRYTLCVLGVTSDKFQTKYKVLVQAMKTQLGLDELPEFAENGEVAPLTPFLRLESERDVVYEDEKKVVKDEPASSSKAVEDKAVPTELAIQLQPGESKAAVVNETLATNQIWQLSCEYLPKELGVEGLSSEFNSNGEVTSFIPFLDKDSETGASCMKDSEEVVCDPSGRSSKGVQNEVAPTDLATKLQFGENEAAMDKETLQATQNSEASCEPIPEETGADVLSSKATDWAPSINSSGNVTHVIPLLDMESEAGGFCMKESEEVDSELGGSSEEFKTEVAPTELPNKLHLGESDTILVEAQHEANQIRQSTCESVQTENGMNVPSLKPTDWPPEFSSNGEATFIVPFYDMKSEAGSAHIGERKAEIKVERGSSNKGVETGPTPTELANKMQLGKNEAASVKETRKASHIQQQTCDPFQTTPKVEVSSQYPTNSITPVSQEQLVHATITTMSMSTYGIVHTYMARLRHKILLRKNQDQSHDTIDP